MAGLVGNNCRTIGAWAFHPRRVNQHLIGPVLRQQCRVKGNLPFGHPTVIDGVAVQHLDAPRTVHRTADQVGERAVGVIHISHLGHIGGVDTTVMHRGGRIHIASGCVLVTLVGGIRPTIVPRNTHAIAIFIRITLIGAFLIHSKSKMRACGSRPVPSPFRSRNLAGAGGRTAVILLQNRDILLVRASQLDINIADVGVFDFNADKQNVVGGLYSGRRGETGKRNRRDV